MGRGPGWMNTHTSLRSKVKASPVALPFKRPPALPLTMAAVLVGRRRSVTLGSTLDLQGSFSFAPVSLAQG